ncbi:MAG: FAD-dependent oxidoreductase [Patescibacteria group bacterium]|nr:FAD-dependent oxidoreductase [Patescibacteria group bacterium]MDE2437953.1 FAD-dependent oxidoreductase [Patescibacteria group bacterium]
MKLNLIGKKTEVPGVESFIFQPPESLHWKAGQFFHYVLHHRPTDDRGSDRWFTISSAPFENVVMITTRFTEEKGSTFKKALANLSVGDSIEVTDIEGDFILEDLTQDYVFIAGGIGITPFHSILKELDHRGEQAHITLLYGNRDEHIVFKDELGGFAKSNPQLKIQYIIAPERIDIVKIQEFVPDMQKPIFYISGPEPMVDALGTSLRHVGVSEDRIKQDWFPGYQEE